MAVYKRFGTNMRVAVVGDDIVIKINHTLPGSPSNSGKSNNIALSGGFAKLGTLFPELDGLGFTGVVSRRIEREAKPKAKPAAAEPVRKKPIAQPVKPAIASGKVKKKKARDDDDVE